MTGTLKAAHGLLRKGLAAPMSTPAPAETRQSSTPLAFAVVVVFGLIGFIHRETFASLVSVWLQSQTFMHCFLIAPISGFLIWQRRHDLARAPKRVSTAGLVALAALTVVWALASAADVQFGMQLVAVLLIPAVVLALIGVQATKTIAFPLGYLVFAVPFGEALVPQLMDITAAFAVAFLKLTGIPVLREGLYFSIPSGDFEVAQACSGIRYLIACLALGVLYAQLFYRSWTKRAIFIAVSIVAPIIANGIRAYAIVMIAHLSDMRLAIGIDHFIYGWVFFAGLVALLFWVGGRFQDASPRSPGGMSGVGAVAPRGRVLVATSAAALALVAVGPLALEADRVVGRTPASVALPVLNDAFSGPRAGAGWHEGWLQAERVAHGLYFAARDGAEVEVDVLTFGSRTDDLEMVGSLSVLIDRDQWQVLDTGSAAALVGGAERTLGETLMRSRGGVRVFWHWYRVDGVDVARDWEAKLHEAWLALRGRTASHLIVVSTESLDAETARTVLRAFLEHTSGPLGLCLDSAWSDCVVAPR